jgi:hypothetical protein
MRQSFAVALCFTVLILLPNVCHAQVAAYFTYSPTDFLLTGNASISAGGIANGGTLGVSFEHLHEGRFVTAVDLKNTFASKTHARGDAAAVDYRIAFVPHRVPLKPFIELGLGVVTVHDPNAVPYRPTPSITDAVLDLALGLDIRLNHSFDLRIADQGDAPFRSNASSGSVGASILDLGVVCNFR